MESDSKKNPKTKSEKSGKEKHGDEDCQQDGQKKKENKHKWVSLHIDMKPVMPREKLAHPQELIFTCQMWGK